LIVIKIILVIIIFFAGSINLFSKKNLPPDKTYGLEYFPIKMGIVYEYSSNIGDVELTTEQDGKDIHFKYDDGKISFHQFYSSDQSGLIVNKIKSEFLFFCSEATYNKPLVIIPFPLTLNSKWNWNGIEYKGDESFKVSVKGEVLCEETIETKAGKFDCIKIKLVIISEDGGKSILTEWLAPNIGMIKEEAQTSGKGLTGYLQKIFGLNTFKFELASITKY
jgi:hypothetical protein